MKKIGVLALQGDFARHAETVVAAGGEAVEVREPSGLNDISGLIIPGGESTTIGKLLIRYNMAEPLKQFAALGKAIYGTCAGTIILSTQVEKYDQLSLGLLDIQVQRNAYGRQIDSFEASVSVPILGEIPLRGVFIRAPVITAVGRDVEVLAEFEGHPIFVRQGKIISTTFHPELTGDTRLHRYFLSLAYDEPAKR
jgi:5'-phosphate synthase pdxT subunit